MKSNFCFAHVLILNVLGQTESTDTLGYPVTTQATSGEAGGVDYGKNAAKMLGCPPALSLI